MPLALDQTGALSANLVSLEKFNTIKTISGGLFVLPSLCYIDSIELSVRRPGRETSVLKPGVDFREVFMVPTMRGDNGSRVCAALIIRHDLVKKGDYFQLSYQSVGGSAHWLIAGLARVAASVSGSRLDALALLKPNRTAPSFAELDTNILLSGFVLEKTEELSKEDAALSRAQALQAQLQIDTPNAPDINLGGGASVPVTGWTEADLAAPVRQALERGNHQRVYLGTVEDEVEMLELDGEQGDWCLREDLGRVVFEIIDTPEGEPVVWQQVSYTTSPTSRPLSAWLTDLTGTVNQRDQILSAMTETAAAGLQLVVDVPALLDTVALEEIWAPTGLDMAWAPKGEIRIRNNYRPGIVFLNTKVKLQQPKFVYIGPGLDASVSPLAGVPFDTAMAVNVRLKNRLASQYNVTFNDNMDPMWYGPNVFHATILLLGATEIDFSGDFSVHAPAGVAASTFCPYGITTKGQWKTNSVIGAGADATLVDWPILRGDRVSFDGVLMGIQGSLKHLKLKELHSKRYSDLMGANGTNIGGIANYFPPPHLVYFNDGTGLVQIESVNDEGIWVTTHADPAARRASNSGNCNSLKFMGAPGSYIGHVHCLRPDGMMDVIGGATGTGFSINSFYAEYDSNLSDGLFPCIRWPSGPFVNTKFLNGKIVDKAARTKARGIGYSTDVNNRNVTIKNVEVVMNDIEPGTTQGTWQSGAGHDLDITYRILNHTDTTAGRGMVVIEGGPANTPKYTKIKATIVGWRSIYADPAMRQRIIGNNTSGGTGTGVMVAEVNDLTNGYTAKQEAGIRRERWTMKGIVSAPNGASVAVATVKIPSGWTVVETALATKTALGVTNGLTGYTVGWSGTPAGVGTIAVTTTSGRLISTTPIAAIVGNRDLIITPTGGNFDGTGVIEINLTLELVSFGE